MLKSTFQGDRSKYVKILIRLYLIPFLLFLSANCFFSFFQTTYTELNQSAEIPLYKKDSPLLVLFLIIIAVAVFWLLSRKKDSCLKSVLSDKGKELERAALFAAGGISLFFVLAFRAVACSESASVNNAALEMLNGNFSTFNWGGVSV